MSSDLSSIPDAPVEDRLAFAITEIARQAPDRLAIVVAAGADGRRQVSYAALAASIVAIEASLDAVRPVGVVARATTPEALVAIAAASGSSTAGSDAEPGPRRMPRRSMRDWRVEGANPASCAAPPGP
jgi:hypothetical protein